MEVGISSATFFNRRYNEDVFDELRRMNCGICEVFLTTFSEYGRDFAELLRARQGNIRVHSVHTLNQNFEPELFNVNPRTFRDAWGIYRTVLESARILGARNYTFHGSARLKKRKYVFDYDFLGRRVQQLVDKAAEYGVTLCYENVHWTYFSEPEYFSELSRRVTGLGSCLDVKQAMQAGIDYRDYVRAMDESLRTVHLCDYDADGKLTLPGKGIFDVAGLVRCLHDRNLDPPILLELYANDYRDLEEVAEAFEWVKKVVAQA